MEEGIMAVHLAATDLGPSPLVACCGFAYRVGGQLYAQERIVQCTDIPPRSSMYHHLTPQDCREGIPWEYVREDLLQHIRDKKPRTLVTTLSEALVELLGFDELREGGVDYVLNLAEELDYVPVAEFWYREELYARWPGEVIYPFRGQVAAKAILRIYEHLEAEEGTK